MWYRLWGQATPTYPQTSDVSYTYDGGSRLRATMVDASGTSQYQYDERDRLVQYKPPKPAGHDWIMYEYNNLDQKTSVNNEWNVTEYSYYANGWLKQVTYGLPAATYTYDQVGNRTRVGRMNGTYTLYQYDTDPRYRLTSIEHRRQYPSDVLLGTISYSSRDDSGNPLSVTDWDGTVGYTYDGNNRLDSATGADYNYDWVGNRLNPPADPNAMVYDATDKLVTWPGQHQYTYYPTGSIYQQKDSGGTAQKTYTYTGAELLESVTHAGVANPSTMVWDGDSNRVSFTSSTGGTTEFVYDPTAGIPAVIQEASPSAYVYYVREPNGALLMRDDGSTFHHYHFDALGSTRMITDYQGNVTDTYAYDAWGKLTDHTRNTGSIDQPYMYVGQLGYYSHYQDSNLDLLQLGVRFYDPETGRFTQIDPIRDGLGPYTYVENTPLTAVDPTGLVRWTCKRKKPPGWLPNPWKTRGKHDWCYGCRLACIEHCIDKYLGDSCKYEECEERCWNAYNSCLLRKCCTFQITDP